MKKIAVFMFMTGLLCTATAQNITFEPGAAQELTLSQALDTTVVFHATVKNTSNQTLNIKGIRSVWEKPRSWVTNMCFGQCYAASVDETELIEFWPDDELDFELDVELSSQETGRARVDIAMLSSLGDSLVLSFSLSAGSSSINMNSGVPKSCRLKGNYPNPFNPQTDIVFTVDRPAEICLKIYSIDGKLLNELFRPEVMMPGEYHMMWNGRDGKGSPAPSGTYIYRLVSTDREENLSSETRKMILLK